jgi:hypothetical protein
MEMQSVISSNISSAGFDAATNTMRVQFNNGGVYEALGITQSDFDTFMAAKSKGSHFSKVMKRAFTWAKIEKKG